MGRSQNRASSLHAGPRQRAATMLTTQGPSWGYSRVSFDRLLWKRGRFSPNVDENEEMAPRTRTGYPHEGPFVEDRVVGNVSMPVGWRQWTEVDGFVTCSLSLASLSVSRSLSPPLACPHSYLCAPLVRSGHPTIGAIRNSLNTVRQLTRFFARWAGIECTVPNAGPHTHTPVRSVRERSGRDIDGARLSGHLRHLQDNIVHSRQYRRDIRGFVRKR